MYKNDKELTLNAETFTSLKADFDSILNRTIGNMEMKGADEATVTLKLSIKLDKTTTYMENGALDVTRPSFKHDVSSVMQVKDKKSGQLNEEMALVFDEESGSYLLRPITNGQMSFGTDGHIYDSNGEVVDAEFRDVNETEVIKGSAVPLLETTATDDDEDSENEDQENSVEDAEDEEPLPFTEDDDEPNDEVDEEMSKYEWLRQFAGETMIVTESMGNYAVRVKESGSLVLSTAVSEESPAYVTEDKVKDLVGEELICARYVVEDKDVNVAIECEAKGVVVADADAPEE